LDVSNNTILSWFNCQFNSLPCIQVSQAQLDDVSTSVASGRWIKNDNSNYSTDCN